jgi:hypothetical protein
VEGVAVHRAELLYSVPGIYFLNTGRYLSRVVPNPHTGSTYCWIEQSPRAGIFTVGVCQMVQVLRADLLDAMKDCLRDLENVKLLSPDDLDILDEKRILRQKIDELENQDSDGHEMSLTSPIVQSQQWRREN